MMVVQRTGLIPVASFLSGGQRLFWVCLSGQEQLVFQGLFLQKIQGQAVDGLEHGPLTDQAFFDLVEQSAAGCSGDKSFEQAWEVVWAEGRSMESLVVGVWRLCSVTFDVVKERVEDRLEQERYDLLMKQLHQLVQAGGSEGDAANMLGVGKSEFAKMLAAVGERKLKFKSLTTQEDADLWHIWDRDGLGDSLEDLVLLVEKTGFSLHVIWPLVQDYMHTKEVISRSQQKRRAA